MLQSSPRFIDKEMNGKQRNKYLDFVKLNYPDDWCLVLDADELITSKYPKNNWEELSSAIFSIVNSHNNTNSFSFDARHIFLKKEFDLIPYNPQRLFRTGKVSYFRDVFENPWVDSHVFLGVSLFHFLPSLSSRLKKMKNWYKRDTGDFGENISNKISPSQTEGFQEWKEYNPKRDSYY